MTTEPNEPTPPIAPGTITPAEWVQILRDILRRVARIHSGRLYGNADEPSYRCLGGCRAANGNGVSDPCPTTILAIGALDRARQERNVQDQLTALMSAVSGISELHRPFPDGEPRQVPMELIGAACPSGCRPEAATGRICFTALSLALEPAGLLPGRLEYGSTYTPRFLHPFYVDDVREGYPFTVNIGEGRVRLDLYPVIQRVSTTTNVDIIGLVDPLMVSTMVPIAMFRLLGVLPPAGTSTGATYQVTLMPFRIPTLADIIPDAPREEDQS